MKTTINAKAAQWSDAIQAKWDGEEIEGFVTNANWYTARPYVDEYNRGSTEEGFIYTISAEGQKLVYFVAWDVGMPDAAYIEPRSPVGAGA